MNNGLASDRILFSVVIAVGVALFAFAPALVRLQIRLLKWQIEWMEQPWASWPLRFFGAAFVLFAVVGLISQT
ncbi:MAG: hypothetical protein ABIS38_10210 [Sphingomicrobium sp.]